MKARDCGAYANRNPAAHEVRDDEGSPMRFFFLGFLFGGQKEIRPPEAMKQIGSGKVTPPAGAAPAGAEILSRRKQLDEIIGKNNTGYLLRSWPAGRTRQASRRRSGGRLFRR